MAVSLSYVFESLQTHAWKQEVLGLGNLRRGHLCCSRCDSNRYWQRYFACVEFSFDSVDRHVCSPEHS